MARIDWYKDGRFSSSVVLKKRDYMLGRDADCDLVLDDPHVSRRQFQLQWDGHGFFTLTSAPGSIMMPRDP